MSIQQYGKKFPILLKTPSPRGQVELLETIGKGNYGYVYKGRLLSTQEIMAVKVVFLKEDELRETLLEMEMLKACDHPNITKFMGCFLKGLDLWICMELCTGGALDSVYRAIKKPFTEDQIASLIYESVKGLDYIHTKVALIHRDIKAGNLLLTESGELKIADFGVSAKLNAPGGRARTFIGTPYWMAPEVIMTDPESSTHHSASYDHKADIWSIGITAIEIADKNPPLSDIHPMRALYLIPNSDLGLAKPKNWSKQFVDFVAICLTKDPNARPSAAKLLEHPFMQKAKTLNRQKILADLVAKAKLAKERKKLGKDVDEDEEEEEEKPPQEPTKAVVETLKQVKQALAANQPGSSISPTSPVAQNVSLSVRDSSFQGFADSTDPEKRVLTPIQIGQIIKAEVFTADVLDDQYVLIGLERGLYFIDLSAPNDRQEPIPLIRNTRFKEIQIIPEYNVIIALSGKNSHIRQYKLSSIRKLIKLFTGLAGNNGHGNPSAPPSEAGDVSSPTASELEDNPYDKLHPHEVEDEAGLVQKWTSDYIKIVGTRDSKNFVIQKTETTVYMAVLFRADVILFEWAKEPYLKFMKLKQFWLPPATPKDMHLLHDGVTAREIYLSYPNEANLVRVDDSQVTEIEVHRDFRKQAKNMDVKQPRWQTFEQIPFSESRKQELQQLMRPATVNRKLASVVGSTMTRLGSRASERYFLATYHRHTRVVDSSGQPMIGAGVGGWKDGVTWMEAPNELVLRPTEYVYAVGRCSIQVADWKSAQIMQTLQVDPSATVKVLSQRPGSLFVQIERKKKDTMLLLLREKQKEPKPDAGGLAKSMSQMQLDQQKMQQQQQHYQPRPPGIQQVSNPASPQNLPQQYGQVTYQYYPENMIPTNSIYGAPVAYQIISQQPPNSQQPQNRPPPQQQHPSLIRTGSVSVPGPNGGGLPMQGGGQPGSHQSQYYAYQPQVQYQFIQQPPQQSGQPPSQQGIPQQHQAYYYVPQQPPNMGPTAAYAVDPRYSYISQGSSNGGGPPQSPQIMQGSPRLQQNSLQRSPSAPANIHQQQQQQQMGGGGGMYQQGPPIPQGYQPYSQNGMRPRPPPYQGGPPPSQQQQQYQQGMGDYSQGGQGQGQQRR
ncbi:hypothetical protein HK098_000835 [Nowakowskiella sp. JEL0407]|nr:hypothetical protein HK098_000835 [Nowakowskiella sp. JEL0407]